MHRMCKCRVHYSPVEKRVRSEKLDVCDFAHVDEVTMMARSFPSDKHVKRSLAYRCRW